MRSILVVFLFYQVVRGNVSTSFEKYEVEEAYWLNLPGLKTIKALSEMECSFLANKDVFAVNAIRFSANSCELGWLKDEPPDQDVSGNLEQKKVKVKKRVGITISKVECPKDKTFPFNNWSSCCKENLESNFWTKKPGLLTQKSKTCSGGSVDCKPEMCKRSKTLESVNPFQVKNVVILQSDLSSAPTSSGDECKELCHSTEACQGWVFNPDLARCYMKNFAAGKKSFTRKNGFISGLKPSFLGLSADDLL
ncbi:uncharacterized protein LOC111715446 isoform X1 [Eurytemora carolleeae]|uniref:uncharacterized protein LOC111715446 isoform X1 n=1 Tax=Eurytemora carolleeae TaxID=1294199 RepID=UPI000C76BAE7|nr:uncharacterized protein LOC111715446 isoform X1 [Eurytemora carolleeae]|eukprot:XP_023346538.1 uncharacterized protein LOC111715446 isoform X1 [Eurytemora affinis]